MGWNYVSIPKHQLYYRWSLWMDKLLPSRLFCACDHFSMLRLNLNHVSKRGPWYDHLRHPSLFFTVHVLHEHRAAYMPPWIGSALVQIIACSLFGAKPLSKSKLVYYQLDSWEPISVKFESEFYNIRSQKCNWSCRLPKWRPFCPGGDELNTPQCQTRQPSNHGVFLW